MRRMAFQVPGVTGKGDEKVKLDCMQETRFQQAPVCRASCTEIIHICLWHVQTVEELLCWTDRPD